MMIPPDPTRSLSQTGDHFPSPGPRAIVDAPQRRPAYAPIGTAKHGRYLEAAGSTEWLD